MPSSSNLSGIWLRYITFFQEFPQEEKIFLKSGDGSNLIIRESVSCITKKDIHLHLHHVSQIMQTVSFCMTWPKNSKWGKGVEMRGECYVTFFYWFFIVSTKIMIHREGFKINSEWIAGGKED